MDEIRQEKLRALPSVDQVLQALPQESPNGLPAEVAARCVREILEGLRRRILEAADAEVAALDVDRESIARDALRALGRALAPQLRRVVNATGVILHTNLGRAPLGREILEGAAHVAAGYSNLEYDLESGARGRREAPVEALLQRLIGAEAAGVANNNAAAVHLCLTALAKGKDVVVSRGELVEIGGGFRVPDVMRQSGALLREVGTTNKTRLADYADALGENTALLLKVHTSNYRIVGFTEEVSVSDLVRLGRERGIPVMVDLGSGCLIDLGRHRMSPEPTPAEALSEGADLVTFSGDKLLGGPQAGVFAGRRRMVERAQSHPLMRAFRLGKLGLALLERTLLAYLDPDSLPRKVPAVGLLLAPESEVRARAERLLAGLSGRARERLRPQILPGASRAGGGTLPTESIPTALIALRQREPGGLSPDEMEGRLRGMDPPVIGRIQDDALLLDLRTVFPEEEAFVWSALESLAEGVTP
ncbi:MAG: L-seryl-tRNA(Sec) selenium transferase [Candidatus Tectomicrobia bacterium]|nr:L-seryl-tRNA(Sec) selenium transferase [Candidatus Tectomicrobia bacterium]